MKRITCIVFAVMIFLAAAAYALPPLPREASGTDNRLTSCNTAGMGPIWDGTIFSCTAGNGFAYYNAGVLGYQTGATARSTLGLAIGSDVQAYSSVLQSLSGLTIVEDRPILGAAGGGLKVAANALTTDNSTAGHMIKKDGSGYIANATDGTDFISPSGAATLTNKTFDAAGTGNVLKQTKYLTLTHPHRCDETGATMGTDKTLVTYGQCTFSASAAYTANFAEYHITVPEDIDTAVDLKVARFKVRLGGADINNQCYKISVKSIANSAAYLDGGGMGDVVSMPFAADASGADGDVETISAVTLTDWKSNVTAGNLLVIRIGRDGENEADAACGAGAGSTVVSATGPLVIQYGSTQ